MAAERIHIGNGMRAMSGQYGLGLAGLERQQFGAHFMIRLERNGYHVQDTLEEVLLHFGIEGDEQRRELRDRFNAVALGRRAIAE